MAAQEQQRLDFTLAPALHEFALRALDTTEDFVFLPTTSNADLKAGIEALAAYAGYTCTVTGSLTTSTDADTGETLYSGSKTIEFSPAGDVPELLVRESEQKTLTLTNVTGDGTANGATIHPGDSAATVQTALRGTGGDYANVVVAGSSTAFGDAVNEKQSIVWSGPAGGGTWTISFDGQTTAPISRAANAADVQSALEALSNIAPGDVIVTGVQEQQFDVEFTGAYAATDVPEMTVDDSGLTGGGGVEITVVTLIEGTASATASNGEYSLHFPYAAGNVASMTVTGTGYGKDTPFGGLTTSTRITVLTLQEGSTGGSTMGATPGYGAGSGTADQQRTILIQEVTPGTLDTGGTPVYPTDIEGEGAALNQIKAFASHIPEGMLDPLSFARIGLEGELTHDWKPQYALIPRRMANLFGATASDANDGTTRTRTWHKLNRRINSVFMESAYYGVDEDAYLLLRGAIQNLSMSVARNADAGTVGGSIGLHFNAIQESQVVFGGTNEVQRLTKSGTVSGGTYTITVTNPDTNESGTTDAIAYNANAAAIQAAIDALDNVEAGDIVVSGGPVSAAFVQLSFAGRFASEDIALVDVDDALITGGGTIEPTTATPGLGINDPTVYNSAFIEADSTRVYFADDDDDLATIDYADAADPHIVTDILGHEWTMGPLWAPLYTENRSSSPSNKVPTARREYGLSLTVPKEQTGTCVLLKSMQEGCTTGSMWVIFAHKCGDYEWRIAFWVSMSEGESYGSDNNLPVRTFPFRLIYNPNGAANIISTFINPLADAF